MALTGRTAFPTATAPTRDATAEVAYAGKAITIFDNRAICAHAGFCTDGLKKVFRMHAEPWIDPTAPRSPRSSRRSRNARRAP
jgi:uncharacterized Fe-S cluster protein YjdI